MNASDCSSSGSTPLAAACFGDALETVRYLVEERGADVNAVDDGGETALSFCAPDGACARYLLSHGAVVGEGREVGQARPSEPNPASQFVSVASCVDGIRARAKAEQLRASLSLEDRARLDDLTERGAEALTWEPEEAAELFREAVAIAPEENALIGLVRSLVKLERLDEAEETARRGLMLFEDATWFCLVGFVLELKQDDQRAAECYERALELEPDNAAALEGLDDIQHRIVLSLPNVSTVYVSNANRFSEEDLANIADALHDHLGEQRDGE